MLKKSLLLSFLFVSCASHAYAMEEDEYYVPQYTKNLEIKLQEESTIFNFKHKTDANGPLNLEHLLDCYGLERSIQKTMYYNTLNFVSRTVTGNQKTKENNSWSIDYGLQMSRHNSYNQGKNYVYIFSVQSPKIMTTEIADSDKKTIRHQFSKNISTILKTFTDSTVCAPYEPSDFTVYLGGSPCSQQDPLCESMLSELKKQSFAWVKPDSFIVDGKTYSTQSASALLEDLSVVAQENNWSLTSPDMEDEDPDVIIDKYKEKKGIERIAPIKFSKTTYVNEL